MKKWEVTYCTWAQLPLYLEDGWEPFSATSVRDQGGLNVIHTIWLRRLVTN